MFETKQYRKLETWDWHPKPVSENQEWDPEPANSWDPRPRSPKLLSGIGDPKVGVVLSSYLC